MPDRWRPSGARGTRDGLGRGSPRGARAERDNSSTRARSLMSAQSTRTDSVGQVSLDSADLTRSRSASTMETDAWQIRRRSQTVHASVHKGFYANQRDLPQAHSPPSVGRVSMDLNGRTSSPPGGVEPGSRRQSGITLIVGSSRATRELPVGRPRHTPIFYRPEGSLMSTNTRDYITVPEFLAKYRVARTTWDDWRAKGTAPQCIRLPNGRLRIHSKDLEQWENDLKRDT
ncbi:hypothetical protein HUW46_09406 [Amycolatopsis sp. CA-230715]|nr:hypothetical protein HUW46_09406 [Amycolatopsis sp. CA-230715]